MSELGVQRIGLKENPLIRYSFCYLLAAEFGMIIPGDDIGLLELAWDCIEVYDSLQSFLELSGWEKDNPDCTDFAYLSEHHICRQIAGKYLYFSQLKFEDGKKKLARANCDGSATGLRQR